MRSREFISELFDVQKAFPIEDWYEDDNYAYNAVAYDSAGSEIRIVFTPLHDKINAVDFEFFRGDSHDITGGGEAGRVFATVFKALKYYLENINEPDYIVIASKGASRTSAYNAMIRRFASNYGYKPIQYSDLPTEITDQPTPEGELFVLAKQGLDISTGSDKLDNNG
jgi:hypothetical protein